MVLHTIDRVSSLKKNPNASKYFVHTTPSQGGKLSKRLDEKIVGCQDKNSSRNSIRFPNGSSIAKAQPYNFGEETTVVILYAFIDRYEDVLHKTEASIQCFQVNVSTQFFPGPGIDTHKIKGW